MSRPVLTLTLGPPAWRPTPELLGRPRLLGSIRDPDEALVWASFLPWKSSAPQTKNPCSPHECMLGGEGSEEERETGPLTPSEVQRSPKPWSAGVSGPSGTWEAISVSTSPTLGSQGGQPQSVTASFLGRVGEVEHIGLLHRCNPSTEPVPGIE